MTRTPWRILVTAVGGDLGQALVKALRLSNVPIVLLGCDADEEGVGGAFVECFRVVPRANDKRYLDELMGLCREFGIQAVIPGSEPEIARLSRMGSSTPCLPSGIPVVCQDGPWIETFGDKLSCMRALEGKVELGAFADGSDARAVEELVKRAGFPMIVKSRRSSGSQSLRIARNGDELARHLAEVPIPLVQQYLDATGGEFSAGLFACDQFESTIVGGDRLRTPGRPGDWGAGQRQRAGPENRPWRALAGSQPTFLQFGGGAGRMRLSGRGVVAPPDAWVGRSSPGRELQAYPVPPVLSRIGGCWRRLRGHHAMVSPGARL